MIQFSCVTVHGTVYIKVAETEAEAGRLSILAREVRMICADCSRTDLWITAEFAINAKAVLVTNLYKPLPFKEGDLKQLEAAITERLKDF